MLKTPGRPERVPIALTGVRVTSSYRVALWPCRLPVPADAGQLTLKTAFLVSCHVGWLEHADPVKLTLVVTVRFDL